MKALLNKNYIAIPLVALLGLSIAIFFDWLDGGIHFTLN